jgi:hypothetical protein
MISKKYDIVVVGSSILSVMHAVAHSKKGLSVAIIEKDNKLGGCWQVESTELGPVENACHLLEPYKGGHDIISEYLDIDFIRLDPQPLTFINKKYRNYVDKKRIIIDFIKSLYLLLLSVFVRFFNTIFGWLFKINKLNNKSLKRQYCEFITKHFYRIKNIKYFDGVYAPKDGFKVIPQKISDAITRHNIDLILDEIVDIKEFDKHCICYTNKYEILSDKVFIPESIVIYNGKYTNIKKSKTFHIILKCDDLDMLSSYIQFPKDKHINRITVIDNKKYANYALLQLRCDYRDIKDLPQFIKNFLLSVGLIKNKNTTLDIVASFTNTYITPMDLYDYNYQCKKMVCKFESVGDITRIMTSSFKKYYE